MSEIVYADDSIDFDNLKDAIAFDEEGKLTPAGTRALGLVIWAQRRIRIPVRLQGTEAQLEALRKPLADAGIDVEEDVVDGDAQSVEATWAVPTPAN